MEIGGAASSASQPSPTAPAPWWFHIPAWGKGTDLGWLLSCCHMLGGQGKGGL